MSLNTLKGSKTQRNLVSSLKSQDLGSGFSIDSELLRNDLLNSRFSDSQEEMKALTDYVRKL